MNRFALIALLTGAFTTLTTIRAHAQAISANFTRISAGETIVAPYTSVGGAPTVGAYAGLTEIVVTGTGFAFGPTVSDAFYFLDGSPVGAYYGFNIGYPGRPFAGGAANNIQNFMEFIDGVGDVAPGATPAYSIGHTYHFVLDLPNVMPGLLRFGVSDGAYSDNGGQYTIQTFSVVRGAASANAPEPSALLLLALPLIGLTIRRRSVVARQSCLPRTIAVNK